MNAGRYPARVRSERGARTVDRAHWLSRKGRSAGVSGVVRLRPADSDVQAVLVLLLAVPRCGRQQNGHRQDDDRDPLPHAGRDPMRQRGRISQRHTGNRMLPACVDSKRRLWTRQDAGKRRMTTPGQDRASDVAVLEAPVPMRRPDVQESEPPHHDDRCDRHPTHAMTLPAAIAHFKPAVRIALPGKNQHVPRMIPVRSATIVFPYTKIAPAPRKRPGAWPKESESP